LQPILGRVLPKSIIVKHFDNDISVAGQVGNPCLWLLMYATKRKCIRFVKPCFVRKIRFRKNKGQVFESRGPLTRNDGAEESKIEDPLVNFFEGLRVVVLAVAVQLKIDS